MVGIGSSVARDSAVGDKRIPFSLAIATNLVLTSLTGNFLDLSTFSAHPIAWPAGRILWIRRAASLVAVDNTFSNRYNRAIGLMYEFKVIIECARSYDSTDSSQA